MRKNGLFELAFGRCVDDLGEKDYMKGRIFHQTHAFQAFFLYDLDAGPPLGNEAK